MPNITLTDTNPAISKAAGGGGPELATLTDTSPAIAKATGGGGPESATLTDTNPTYKAAGGGGREDILLYDNPPVLWESYARAGLNPLFKLLLEDD